MGKHLGLEILLEGVFVPFTTDEGIGRRTEQRYCMGLETTSKINCNILYRRC